mmetsp:Transcript_25765/g.70984  ORF Transcript_25765/g.70984 Transcript_25765/m.70984 type:complete len:87 (-) Transcript_25765:169-429(-)
MAAPSQKKVNLAICNRNRHCGNGTIVHERLFLSPLVPNSNGAVQNGGHSTLARTRQYVMVDMTVQPVVQDTTSCSTLGLPESSISS